MRMKIRFADRCIRYDKIQTTGVIRMKRSQWRLARIAILLLSLITVAATITLAQRERQRDALWFFNSHLSFDDSLVAAMAAAPKKCPNVTCSDLGSPLRSRYCSALSNCG